MIGTPKVLKFKQLPEQYGKGKVWYIQASMVFMIDVSDDGHDGLVKVYIQGEGQDTASLDHILIKTLLGKENRLGDQLTSLMTSRTSVKGSPFLIDNKFHQWISYIDYVATPFAAYCIEPCPCYDAAHWLFIADLPFPGDGDYAGRFADFLDWCVDTECRGSAIGRVGERPDYCSCCPVMPQTWDCGLVLEIAGCVENFDGTGVYTTLGDCEDNCGQGKGTGPY
jgi:hypothetical protein